MLVKCIIVSDDLFVSFLKETAYIRSIATLERTHEIKWNEVLPISVTSLSTYGVTSSHSSIESSEFICSFGIDPEGEEEVPAFSMDDQWRSEEEENKEEDNWIVRVKLNSDKSSLEVVNTKTESIHFKYEYIGYIIEYAKNKLFVTGDPICIFLIDDWQNVRFI